MKSNFTQLNSPKMKILHEDQIREIHSAACEILEKTGMKIKNDKAKELLASHGAFVSDNDRVRIPSYLVEEAILKAPKRVVLCDRNGNRKMFLEKNNVYFGCNPDNPEYYDPYSGERRKFTSSDGADLATVIDYTDNIDFVLNACFSSDVPEEVADRVIIRQMMLNMRKPIGFSCTDADSLLDIIDMAAIVAGGHEELKANPYIFHIQEPISPLMHDDNSLKEVMICAEKGVPIVYYPMTMGGATAPATPAGLLAQTHAESLTGLVIHQLTNAGSPFVYGGVASIMDMKSTRFSYGAPELSLQCAALTDIAHYFELPMWGTAGCIDSKTVDSQAAAEIMMSCLMAGLSGANLVHDTGLMDQATVTCPEVLLLANEIIGMVKKVLQGVDVNKDTLALDIIDKAFHTNNFLETDHTYKNFRNFWSPEIFDRSTSKTAVPMQEKLNKKAIDLIENYKVPPLAEDKKKELLELEKKWLN